MLSTKESAMFWKALEMGPFCRVLVSLRHSCSLFSDNEMVRSIFKWVLVLGEFWSLNSIPFLVWSVLLLCNCVIVINKSGAKAAGIELTAF